MLIRFRSSRVAISADVEAYYLQVHVPPDDADSLRFFWTDDINSNDIYSMQMFGAKDSANCVNFAFQTNARDNYKDFDASTYETILRSVDMDDCLKSLNSVEAMIDLSSDLNQLCNCGGFRLTKVLSNNQAVLNSLPPSEVSSSTVVNLDGEKIERTLARNPTNSKLPVRSQRVVSRCTLWLQNSCCRICCVVASCGWDDPSPIQNQIGFCEICYVGTSRTQQCCCG